MMHARTLSSTLLILLMLIGTNSWAASTIKVLILDDMFQSIPARDEELVRMGKLKGDLLVNGSRYEGDIEVWRGKTSLYLINELPLEEYVKYVVTSEVGTSWDMEALKAQAVISRTYALYQIMASRNGNYDLTSSVLHQVYKGTEIDPRIAYAVMTTEGEVVTYQGKVIETFYHSTSVGSTESPEEVFGKALPYIKPVTTQCETSPYWIWERRIPAEEIGKAFTITGVRELRITDFTSTKRVKTVSINHDGGSMPVKATELRRVLGWNRLPSTNFTVSMENGTFVFDGKGYGHGVGLCQWSALEMAKSGMHYRDILSYFYPGTVISRHADR